MISSLVIFCDECGAANTTQATQCFACQQSLPTPSLLPIEQTPVPYTALSTSVPGALPAPQAGLPVLDDLLAPGSLLAQRYRIVREVGQGGFGVVYEAKDSKRRNKAVAIKQINLRALKPREIIEATDSYNREVTLLSNLRHTNLPRIFDYFTDPEHWYLVMDFIKGKTLEEYLKSVHGGRLLTKEVLKIGIQLCMVLNYLHNRNQPIIFRDVKPANIMRTSKGRLYLIDFGIARQFTPGQTRDTGPLGSPGYAAPEQYGKAQTTVQTDIYGLGVTLQTLLTGIDPSETTAADTSPPPTKTIPKKLQRLLDEMLEQDASNRPKSMDEVKERLNQIKKGVSGLVQSFLWGLLIGSIPSITIVLLFFASQFPSLVNVVGILIYLLYSFFLCTWPFAFFGQLVLATRFLLKPHKRLRGLGILLVQAFLIVAITLEWIPLPFLPFYGFFR